VGREITMYKYAVWNSIDNNVEFFDTMEQAEEYAASVKEDMDEDGTEGWEGGETISIMEVVKEWTLVNITNQYRVDHELEPDEPLPEGWDYISELQLTYDNTKAKEGK
jgi:hypothetical protein